MLYDALKFGCGRKREDSNWIEPVIRTKKGGGTTCVDCDVEKKTKKKKKTRRVEEKSKNVVVVCNECFVFTPNYICKKTKNVKVRKK
mmetsp:Transcript_4428/g.6549  ORF Transcript_4428/g.6549 Transcript_4428/m.6549 type:complete len:87 (-) Transcript_4428:28-288(-)